MSWELDGPRPHAIAWHGVLPWSLTESPQQEAIISGPEADHRAGEAKAEEAEEVEEAEEPGEGLGGWRIFWCQHIR